VKRTTGIPRSFLKTVEKPAALSNDGTTDDTKPPSGVMVNAEGEFVIAEPDKASWEKFQAKTKSSAAAQEAAALGNQELRDRGLECPIDKRIFIDPMKTPCCEKTYCNDCITNALIESDFTCPGCQTDGVLIDDLKPDDEATTKIKAYLEEKTAAKKAEERAKSPPVKTEATPAAEGDATEEIKVEEEANVKEEAKVTEEVKVKSMSPTPKSPAAVSSPALSKSKSPAPESGSAKEEPKSKKRPAEELLENPKIPKGPKAMQQQEAQSQAMSQQQAMMNGMPGMGMGMGMGMGGFPNMPFDMSGQFFPGNGYGSMPMMNGFGMGMGMPNPMMMNPMMGGGMNGFGGYPNMNGMNGFGGAGFGMGNMGGMMNNNMGNGMPANGAGPGAGGAAGGFANQQKTVFAEPLPNEEDNAYFRQPVNPHRHQGRLRRARPSDYTEL
jgi:protein MPE1